MGCWQLAVVGCGLWGLFYAFVVVIDGVVYGFFERGDIYWFCDRVENIDLIEGVYKVLNIVSSGDQETDNMGKAGFDSLDEFYAVHTRHLNI